MAQLAIRGHATRGEEVIEILEMLGGKNPYAIIADAEDLSFTIRDDDNYIIACYPTGKFVFFTLKEFLKKFPYKVGDKVLVKPYVGTRQICEMKWDSDDNCIKYGIGVGEWFKALQLQSYKEETMEENTDKALAPDLKGEDYSGRRFGYKIPNGYEFDCIQNNEIILKPIKPQYPKTYKECCEVLNLTKYPSALTPNKSMYTTQYKDFPHYYEIQKLAQLLVCRDAYWKIAGEQMGLGEPWKPDWSTDKIKYVIEVYRNTVRKNSQGYFNTMLPFPTKEMRDAFKENFDGDIDACKEFL